jgi:hypothetical protein
MPKGTNSLFGNNRKSTNVRNTHISNILDDVSLHFVKCVDKGNDVGTCCGGGGGTSNGIQLNGDGCGNIVIYNDASSNLAISHSVTIDSCGNLLPIYGNNSQSLGTQDHRWSNIYMGQGNINIQGSTPNVYSTIEPGPNGMISIPNGLATPYLHLGNTSQNNGAMQTGWHIYPSGFTGGYYGDLLATQMDACGNMTGATGPAGPAGSGGATNLDELTDVTITGIPTDKQLLVYDVSASQWRNQDPIVSTGIAYKAGIPSTNAATGILGQLSIGGGTLYVCTATNTWQKISLNSSNFNNGTGAGTFQ